MTVTRDLERVHDTLDPLLGEAETDAWIDEPRSSWAGRCAYDLIEAGLTEEVLSAAAAEQANPAHSGTFA